MVHLAPTHGCHHNHSLLTCQLLTSSFDHRGCRDEDFLHTVQKQQERDQLDLESKMRRKLSCDEKQHVGVQNLRNFLEVLLQRRYQDCIPAITSNLNQQKNRLVGSLLRFSRWPYDASTNLQCSLQDPLGRAWNMRQLTAQHVDLIWLAISSCEGRCKSHLSTSPVCIHGKQCICVAV